ncbi:hypothetical protein [Natronorubrum halophilum]|uniref:hypothetical protein n=1 Tax=Natronorubrum halophilum TaxID=1702106 RepID=UPI0010C2201E|nr:hypothetical protein [Natronorubrum halophilum]
MSDQRPVGDALENRLMSHGIYVTEWTRLPNEDRAEDEREEAVETDAEADGDEIRDGTGIALEYETVSESPGVDSQEVGTVVRMVLTVADERDWSPGRLEATSLTTDGERRGRWHVEGAWFDALGREYDQVEFSQRVLETISS